MSISPLEKGRILSNNIKLILLTSIRTDNNSGSAEVDQQELTDVIGRESTCTRLDKSNSRKSSNVGEIKAEREEEPAVA